MTEQKKALVITQPIQEVYEKHGSDFYHQVDDIYFDILLKRELVDEIECNPNLLYKFDDIMSMIRTKAMENIQTAFDGVFGEGSVIVE